jgi:hypothetical protein
VATIFDIFVDGAGSENDPVPAVDPADLKGVWTTQTDSPTLVPGEQLAINVDFYKRVCSPGADVHAVFIRESMLRMLTLMSESGGLISPWLHRGEPDDAVFKVVATFPIFRMRAGVRRGGLPLDVEELIRQIAREAKQRIRALSRDAE